METHLLLTPHNMYPCRPMRGFSLESGKCHSRRWWVSRGGAQVASVLCCVEFDSVVLVCGGIPAMWVLWATRRSHLARERRLCVNRPRWSSLLRSQRAAFTFQASSWCSQNSLSLKQPFDMTHQLSGVQTYNLSVLWRSVQPAPNNTTLPAWVLMSQHWSKLNRMR